MSRGTRMAAPVSFGVWFGLPACVLQHDPVSVRILERLALLVPVRVKRLNRLVPGLLQPGHRPLPLTCVGQIKNQQVVLRRGAADLVPGLAGELQVVRGSLTA